MSDEKKGNQPSHIAYGVQEQEGEKSQFHKIGSAFAHKDGKGQPYPMGRHIRIYDGVRS